MRTLKYLLEKPSLVWVLIAAIYVGFFWTQFREHPLGAPEQATYNIIEQFAESPFPPNISLIRDLPDWGHLGYYVVMGRAFSALKGDVANLRAVHLATMLLSFMVFIWLGNQFTYRNRLSPLWISFSLILFAANPYAPLAAYHLEPTAPLLLLLLLSMHLFERDNLGWSALFTSAAVLVDFRALLLALSFVLTRVTGESSRLLRPERLVAFVLPFVVGLVPVLVWKGVVPQGEARAWWNEFYSKAPLVRPGEFFYALSLLPLYVPFFTWSWGLRARSRALTVGAIVTALFIPFYFLFPIHFDWWDEIRHGTQTPLGLVDDGMLLLAGPYKNLALFVPWFAGTFLLCQLILMDVLDRSRWLRYFIIFFFAIQPFAIGTGDRGFLVIVAPMLLLTLSEALVGEEGKLA